MADGPIASFGPRSIPLAAAAAAGHRQLSATAALMRQLGLRRVTTESLRIRRRRCGRGFIYLSRENGRISDPGVIGRLKALAVPPAYVDVRYSDDPQAHVQAVGRDSARRAQYRYHPAWEEVREMRKARRLIRLLEALPRIRRNLARHLSGEEPTRELSLAAVIELVATSAIRAGSESYARINGTRGAATLLKSNVATSGETVTLSFRAKGGKKVDKEFRARRLCGAIKVLRQLAGRRLFQYRNGDVLRQVRAREVNAFLRTLAGVDVSLKDFRTLCASAAVLEILARASPSATDRGRRKQVLDAMRSAAEELANTPAICRKSYVHATVVTAFEEGVLEQFTSAHEGRSRSRREQFLRAVVATAVAIER
jgi:DNA topoisomerase I